jgi:membrane protein
MKTQLKKFWKIAFAGDLQMIAASLSFTTLLSIIPFFAVSLATLKYVNGLEKIYPKVEALAVDYFQSPTGDEGAVIVKRAFSRIRKGRIGEWGALFLIVASILLINNMERALHRVWNLESRRPLHQRIFFYWLFLILFPAALAVYVTLTSLTASTQASAVVPIALMNGVLIFVSLLFIYKTVPNTKVSFRAASIGALAGSIGLVVLTRSFKWLSQSFFSWGKLYGSVASIPALLIWVLMIWYIVLIGAALTASLQPEKKV